MHVIHNHIQSNKPSLITCALDQSKSTSHIWEARRGFDKLSRELSQTGLPGGYIQAVHMRLRLHWKPVVSLRWVKPFRNHCGDQNWNRLLKQGEKWTKSHIMNLLLTPYYWCVQEIICLCFICTQCVHFVLSLVCVKTSSMQWYFPVGPSLSVDKSLLHSRNNLRLSIIGKL